MRNCARAIAPIARNRRRGAERPPARRSQRSKAHVRSSSVTLLVVGVLARATVVHAQPAGADDANAGHAWLAPTALVPPAGTFAIENDEVFALGAAYAITDRLIASATVVKVPVRGTHIGAFGSVKLQVVHIGRLRVALQAGGMYAYDSDSGGTSDTAFADLAGVATFCIDRDCRSHVDGFAGVGYRVDYLDGETPAAFGGAVVARLAGPVKLVGEVDQLIDASNVIGQRQPTLAWTGVRITSRHAGIDLGAVVCFASAGDCASPRIYPVFVAAYRW